MKKTKKLFTKLAITFGVAFVACMATIPTQMSKYYEEKQEAEYSNAKKYASYNDLQSTIDLTADELNNYSWNNLNNYLLQLEHPEDIFGVLEQSYNDDEYLFVLEESYSVGPNSENIFLNFSDENMSLHFGADSEGPYYLVNKFNMYDSDLPEAVYITFEHNLQLTIVSTYYADIKQAIELDIQANQPHTIAGDIIASITAGLGMIGVLAGEFLTGFSTLFWTGSELTTFALFSLVFLGISITFAVISLVLSILRNNTGV